MFGPCEPFQRSLMFGAYLTEALFRCFTLELGSGFAHKNWNVLEKPTKEKHSSLLRSNVKQTDRRTVRQTD
jgi:hypothetical protein